MGTFFHSTTTEKPQQQGNKEYKHKKHSAFYIPPEGAPGISLCSLDHTGVKKNKIYFLFKKIIIFFCQARSSFRRRPAFAPTTSSAAGARSRMSGGRGLEFGLGHVEDVRR